MAPAHQQLNNSPSSSNNAAYLLQQLGFGLFQQQQQQAQSQQHLQLVPVVSPQQQHQPLGQFQMTSVMANSNSMQRMPQFDRERQIKRRTKTGCLTCRKRRIKCDEAKPTCFNCQKSRRECEGYTSVNVRRSESSSPPNGLQTTNSSQGYTSDYSTPSNLTLSKTSFSPLNQRRVPVPQSPTRFSPYEVPYPRTPVEQNLAKEFDPLSGSEYLATDFANEFSVSDLSNAGLGEDMSIRDDLTTPPPTARISVDSLLNLSSAALIHPPIDAPLNALFSPSANLLPPALIKPQNAALFAHWINVLSSAMSTLDRFPSDSAVLETTPGIHYPNVRVPHEDAVYSFLIPHLAMASTGTAVLHACLACAASHRRDRILGMKHYHLAVRAIREDLDTAGVTHFVALVLLGMYEVLGGKGIRCMYMARDWILEHKVELMAKLYHREDGEVTVGDVIIENMMWTFARTAVHRGLSSSPSITPREGFILPMSDFRDLYVPREGQDSTVGVGDSMIILIAQVLSLPTLGENELKAHVASQLRIWPSTLPRMFRHQWTSQNTISTTSLNAVHFLHPSIAAIHLLHRSAILYSAIYFDFNVTRKSSPEAITAARDVLRITQPLMDEASSGRWSVLGALTLAFCPVIVAGQFLRFHLRDTPFVLPQLDWLDESLGEIVETEEDVELREVERMIDRLKVYLGGVQGRVVEL